MGENALPGAGQTRLAKGQSYAAHFGHIGSARVEKERFQKFNSRTNRLAPQNFGKKAVIHYGEEWYNCQQEAKYIGDEYVNGEQLLAEFPYIHAQVLALGLQYIFVDQSECNLGIVHEFYGNWNTHHVRYLRALEIEKEIHDVCPPHSPHFVCHLVDVTNTKAHHQSQGKVLSIADRQAWDDKCMRRMYGMAELQLRIGSHSVTEDELETLAERYLLTDSVMYMCWIGLVFQEPIDDYDATTDEDDGPEEDESNDIGPGDDDTDTGDSDGRGLEQCLSLIGAMEARRAKLRLTGTLFNALTARCASLPGVILACCPKA
ncbi:hypothetical protein H5410_036999 [Solanum commersonii]|uniref:Uncharacterized protein n=1 Tax=Solanum commersonii TaxID=4109 RepID=A0A9J5Y796_SOLCO|nr:hypothetical protein H5410_036999 [Solanum commersonii]